MGSPLDYCTLIFDLMRNLYIYNACIYIYSIYINGLKNNIVSDAQFELRQNKSTVDVISILNAAISKIVNNKGRLYCAFIDLRKAFDCVIRYALWYKIHRFRINAKPKICNQI